MRDLVQMGRAEVCPGDENPAVFDTSALEKAVDALLVLQPPQEGEDIRGIALDVCRPLMAYYREQSWRIVESGKVVSRYKCPAYVAIPSMVLWKVSGLEGYFTGLSNALQKAGLTV